MNLAAMMAHKDKVVFKITKGVESLFKKNKMVSPTETLPRL
ncbi:putative leghemoglobin reductase [Helianthus annuus]|nr:putative leghemoglobin reductase [Helianthus annuus]KAJ0571812.1 putative leghemoglobin reductase [Helianthus annuus]KAJ0920863.1 putative leghemoglobin reductase [Helianthus annuus]KAJ0924457.1 putative leghemoglobin reductase [Helianthus annuus]